MLAKKRIPTPIQSELFRASDLITIDPKISDLLTLARPHIDNNRAIERLGILHPSTVFEHILSKAQANQATAIEMVIEGVRIFVAPRRVMSFERRLSCARCGCVGNAFLVEKHVNQPLSYSLNLYSITGSEMRMMTVDHILPDSMGGRYDITNFQTMCAPCNQSKKNLMSVDEIGLIRQKPTLYCKSWVHVPYLMELLTLQELLITATGQRSQRLTNVLEKWCKAITHATHQGEVEQKTEQLRKLVKIADTGLQPVSTRISWATVIQFSCNTRKFAVELGWVYRRTRTDLTKAVRKSFSR